MPKLKLLSFAALLALPVVAYADRVDCSAATHWNSDHRYKKDDRVWHHEGGNSYELYRCDKGECVGAANNEPGSGETWKRLGMCDKDPS
jgi:hypothetical protein